MDIYHKIEKWLEVNSLEEILEEEDLTEEEVLYILFAHGHLKFPPWLEDDLEYGDE
jgi:hypothetical protein